MDLKYQAICTFCGAKIKTGEKCSCSENNTQSTNLIKGDILYLCDRRACKRCHPTCKHTKDITHAQRFELFSFVDGVFIEKEYCMKLAYYIFSMEQKIETCGQCPMLDRSGLGFWCNKLNAKVTNIKSINTNCPLVYIEGKVDQN